MKSDIKIPILIFFILLFVSKIEAQNQSLINFALAEINKRGLTQMEVQQRLVEEGINVEAISPADYPKYQNQIFSVLNKMQAEKNQTKNVLKAQTNINDDKVSIISKTTPLDSLAQAEPSQIKPDSLNIPPLNPIYGHSIFLNKSLDLFRTTDGAEAPETYILGVGDDIRISIFGTSQTDIQQKVSDDGSIQPSGISKIFVKGLSLKQARKIISKRLANYYDFRSDQLVIRVDVSRTIMINIFGEVAKQGSFNISALNSAFNAISASGGPTQIASIRQIQWIRGNKKTFLDFYDFMKDPSINADLSIQNNDILFVPVAQKIVSIQGSVIRPMKYEITEKENLINLIEFAGGIRFDARPDYVKIRRIVDGQEKLFEYDLQKILDGSQSVDLKNGDRISISSIKRPLENYVDIEGAVYYPGRFDLQSNSKLSTLIENAQPNYNAKTDLVLVERTRPNLTIELLTLPLVENLDFNLKPRDKVQILDLRTYTDLMELSVVGSVREPFSRSISFDDNLTIKKAIEIAGGVKPTAYQNGYIFRKNRSNPEQTIYIPVNIQSDSLMLLGAGDRLNIYDNTTFTDFGNIRLSGAVNNSQNLIYDPSLTLQDLIISAGGFTTGAAYNKIQVFRTELSTTQPVDFKLIELEVDSDYKLKNPQNFQLQPYDHLVVRLTPEFNFGTTIEINGQVKYPGVYVIKNNKSNLGEVINMAGGLLEDADIHGATLFRTYKNRGDISFELDKITSSAFNTKTNPILFGGDIININRTENTVAIFKQATGADLYKTSEDGSEFQNYIYQGNKSAKWYINNFSGGFQKFSNKRSVTVTLPNKKTMGTRSFLGIIIYPKVKPGSSIRVRIDDKKQQRSLEPKEKIDLETSVAKSFSTLTSILSIILLVERL